MNKLLRFFKSSKSQVQPSQTSPNNPAIPKSTFNIDELTEQEIAFSNEAEIQLQDALFLKKLTRRPIEKLAFEDYTDQKKPDAICSLTSEVNARKIVIEHRAKFIKEGKYIFISELAHNGYKVALIGTTSDPYKVMEYAYTNGMNYNIETKDIIEKYKKWDKEFGINPIAIGFDFCECEIINKDIDYKKLADEVYEFCHDVVDQGTGSVELLEEEMKRTGTIFLWWD
ncbi:MAG TPA: DUF4253 domain-containing protein [Niastella sp.]